MNQFEMLNEVELMELDGGTVPLALGPMEMTVQVICVTMKFYAGVRDGFKYAVEHYSLVPRN